jgi:hypothetical protein
MTKPGFGARASLYKSGGRYRVAAVWSGKSSGEVGLAQVRPRQCTPFCVQACTPDSESQTGFSRFCINSECEPVRQPCPQLPRVSGADDCWYGHWCGPGCGGGDSIDDLDECCRAHDRCYDARGWGACSCDRELVACALPKKFSSDLEKAAAAAFTVELFSGKVSSGLCSEVVTGVVGGIEVIGDVLGDIAGGLVGLFDGDGGGGGSGGGPATLKPGQQGGSPIQQN